MLNMDELDKELHSLLEDDDTSVGSRLHDASSTTCVLCRRCQTVSQVVDTILEQVAERSEAVIEAVANRAIRSAARDTAKFVLQCRQDIVVESEEEEEEKVDE